MHGTSYGLDLIAASDGALRRVSIYRTLSGMEDSGLIISREESRPSGAVGLPRRLYSLTAHGAKVIRAWNAFVAVLCERATP